MLEDNATAELFAGNRSKAVTAYYGHVDAGEVSSLVGLFTDDAVYHRPGYPPLVGHADIARFYATDRVIADGRHDLEQLVVDGASVAVHGTFNGVLKDGTAVSLDFADFFTLTPDGRFSERRTFFGVPAV